MRRSRWTIPRSSSRPHSFGRAWRSLRSNVSWAEWREPLDLDAEVAVVRDLVPIGAVLGSVVTRDVEPGERILWSGILMPGHPGFISAVLNPGMLGFTVEVDRATTSAAIIYPGDYVDVLVVATALGDDRPSTKAVVRGVRVLAVGSLVMTLNRYGTISLTDAGQVEPPPRPVGDSYTLEVTPAGRRTHRAGGRRRAAADGHASGARPQRAGCR